MIAPGCAVLQILGHSLLMAVDALGSWPAGVIGVQDKTTALIVKIARMIVRRLL